MNINKFFILVSLCICAFISAHAEIHTISSICKVNASVKQDTLLFLNIAEVCTDSSISLGSSPWRKYIKRVAPQWHASSKINIHDYLTLLTATEIPSKPPEEVLPQLIRHWQKKGVTVLALTSRGKNEWYDTSIAGVDRLTEKMLDSIGIDFSQTVIPDVLKKSLDPDSYGNGILYASHTDKGILLQQLLVQSGYRPACVVLVDDKLDSLKEVEKAMQALHIPFIGYWYRHMAEARHNFDPMVAHVQLLFHLRGENLSDQEAKRRIKCDYKNRNPDEFFLEVWDEVFLSWELPNLVDIKL